MPVIDMDGFGIQFVRCLCGLFNCSQQESGFTSDCVMVQPDPNRHLGAVEKEHVQPVTIRHHGANHHCSGKGQK
jgi:hypothetical protein